MEVLTYLPVLLLLLFNYLPIIQGDVCSVRRDYMNIRHALKIPYNYESYSDSYLYGTKIQCSKITLEGNKTLETYINTENLEQAKIAQLVYITDSNLETIEAGAFDPINKLRKLLIGKNKIKNIQPYVFNLMQNLSDLQLYDNVLSKMEKYTFDGCSSLKILNLANNKLTSLENFNISSLQKLHVENNLISSINVNDFQNLKSLRTLNLSCNSISYLDENLFNNLINLTELHIGYNKIGYVPGKLFKSSILNLDMSHNQIRSIDCDKFNGVVDLSYNEIINICNFVNSTNINLSHNKINYISSKSFENLNKLRSLKLNHNNIGEVHVNAFIDLFNLTSLNISYNQISKMYIGTFHNVNELEELDLSNNNLETFEHGIFTGLTSLVRLDLSNNRIENLDLKVFYPLFQLEILNLQNNYIQIIDPNRFLSHLPDLRFISLDFGKISCDSLMRLIHTFSEKYVRIEKGNAVKVHNINGIACDPNLHNDPFSVDNSTEVIQISNVQKDVTTNYDKNIANTMSSIHSVLVLACVVFILFLIAKSVVLILKNFRHFRRNSTLPTCSLKLLSENE